MTDVYLFGTNRLGRQISFYMKEDARYNLLGFTLSGQYCDSKEAHGLPLVPFEELSERGGDFGIINCVGYSKAFSNRQQVDEVITKNSIPLLTYIHKDADIDYDVEIGIGCIIFKRSHILECCKIGNSNIIQGGAIGHDVVTGNYNFFGYGSVCGGNITVADYCFIGENATIKTGIQLASYTTVGAATYVKGNTVEYEILSPPKSDSRKYGRPLFLD
ncbi:MAG: hypothetical protein FWC75_02370 [Oscillospiraceae bacterium]|nr:hypothetical protein [Oscillospiraceae bacterium]